MPQKFALENHFSCTIIPTIRPVILKNKIAKNFNFWHHATKYMYVCMFLENLYKYGNYMCLHVCMLVATIIIISIR